MLRDISADVLGINILFPMWIMIYFYHKLSRILIILVLLQDHKVVHNDGGKKREYKGKQNCAEAEE